MDPADPLPIQRIELSEPIDSDVSDSLNSSSMSSASHILHEEFIEHDIDAGNSDLDSDSSLSSAAPLTPIDAGQLRPRSRSTPHSHSLSPSPAKSEAEGDRETASVRKSLSIMAISTPQSQQVRPQKLSPTQPPPPFFTTASSLLGKRFHSYQSLHQTPDLIRSATKTRFSMALDDSELDPINLSTASAGSFSLSRAATPARLRSDSTANASALLLSPSHSIILHRLNESHGADLTLAGELGLKLVEENAVLSATLHEERELLSTMYQELNYYKLRCEQLSLSNQFDTMGSNAEDGKPVAEESLSKQSAAASNRMFHSHGVLPSLSVTASPRSPPSAPIDYHHLTSQSLALQSLREFLRLELAHEIFTDDIAQDLLSFRRQLTKERRDSSVTVRSMELSFSALTEANEKLHYQYQSLQSQRNSLLQQIKSNDEQTKHQYESSLQAIQHEKESLKSDFRTSVRSLELTVQELKVEKSSLERELLLSRERDLYQTDIKLRPFQSDTKPLSPSLYRTPAPRHQSNRIPQLINFNETPESPTIAEADEVKVTNALPMLTPLPIDIYAEYAGQHLRTQSLAEQIASSTETPIKLMRDSFHTARSPADQRLSLLSASYNVSDGVDGSGQSLNPSHEHVDAEIIAEMIACERCYARVAAALQTEGAVVADSPSARLPSTDADVLCTTLETNLLSSSSWTSYFASLLASLVAATMGIKRSCLEQWL